MKIFCSEDLFPGWLVSQISPPQISSTFFAKGTFSLKPGKQAEWADEAEMISGDKFIDDNPLKGLLYPSDFVPFKPKSDIVVNAVAHAPGKKPVTGLETAISVGRLSKRILVVGKRRWKRSPTDIVGISKPEPFTEMPVVYENSFGGGGFPLNPVGKGKATDELPYLEIPGRMVRNVGDTIEPAGFGALPSGWQQRKRHAGTYGDSYLQEKWPWFPEDFDWHYFNAAPPDQQVEGYLQGDETLTFTNLHVDYPKFQSQLPGLKVRCFFEELIPDEKALFREVPLNLDTLWVDLENEKLVLVWRGLANVRTMKLKEISKLFVFAESLTAPKLSLQDYQNQLQERIAREDLEDEEEIQALAIPSEQDVEDPDIKLEKFDQEVMAAQLQVDKAEADHMALLPGSGIDPKLFEPGPAPDSLADARSDIQAVLFKLQEVNPEHAAELQELEAELSEIEDLEDSAIADEGLPLTREAVIIGAERGDSFAGRRLAGLDLSKLDLSGLNFTKVDLRDTSLVNTDLGGTDLSQADLSGADLEGADLTGAMLDGASLNEALLSNAKVSGMSISGADFSGLNLQGLDFSRCEGTGADFSGADLSHAIFRAVKLPRADFGGCMLEAADFSSAELQAAQFEAVKASDIIMENADISGLHASEGSDFMNGNFRNSRASGSIWEDSLLEMADFSRADLSSALFPDARLNKTRFDRALLTSAVFDDAALQEAIMTNANMLRVSFERADLTNAKLNGSNLYEAGFCEAVLDGTDFRFSYLKGTLLA